MSAYNKFKVCQVDYGGASPIIQMYIFISDILGWLHIYIFWANKSLTFYCCYYNNMMTSFV